MFASHLHVYWESTQSIESKRPNNKHLKGTINGTKVLQGREIELPTRQTYRWRKSIDQMYPGLSARLEERTGRARGRRREEEEEGGGLLAIRRCSNGVFQFAVAGNERRLKPGQLFSLRRGGE